MLSALLRRVAHPGCALRMSKEETCLAVSALAKLRLDARAIRSVDWQMLRARVAQAVPHCNAMELAMIASATATVAGIPVAVPPGDGDVLDALVGRCQVLPADRMPLEDAAAVAQVLSDAGLEDGSQYDSVGSVAFLRHLLARLQPSEAVCVAAQVLRATAGAVDLVAAGGGESVRAFIAAVEWVVRRSAELDTQGAVDALVACRLVSQSLVSAASSNEEAVNKLAGLRSAAIRVLAAASEPFTVDQASDLLGVVGNGSLAEADASLLQRALRDATNAASRDDCTAGSLVLLLESDAVRADPETCRRILAVAEARHVDGMGAAQLLRCLAAVAAVVGPAATTSAATSTPAPPAGSRLIEAVRAHFGTVGSGGDVPMPVVFVSAVLSSDGSIQRARVALAAAGLPAAVAAIEQLEGLTLESLGVSGGDDSDAAPFSTAAAASSVVDPEVAWKRLAVASLLVARRDTGRLAQAAPFVNQTALARRVASCLARQPPATSTVRQVTAVLVMAERCFVRDVELLRALVLRVSASAVSDMTMRDASGLLLALQSLPSSIVPTELAAALREKIHGGKGLEHTALPNVLLGMAERGEEITDEIMIKLAGTATAWGGDDLAKIIAALVMARRDVTALVPMLRPTIPHLALPSVALLFTAMGRNAALRGQLLDDVCRQAERMLPHALDVTAVATAFATLNAREHARRLHTLIADRIASGLRTLGVESLCVSLATLEHAESSPTSLVQTVSAHLAPSVDSMSVVQLSCVVECLGRFEPLHTGFFDAAVRRFRTELTAVGAQPWEPATCAVFLAACQRAAVPELDLLAHRCVAQCLAKNVDLEFLDASSLVPQLLASLPRDDVPRIGRKLADRALAALPQFGSDDCARLSRALLIASGAGPGPGWATYVYPSSSSSGVSSVSSSLVTNAFEGADTIAMASLARVTALIKESVPVSLEDLLPVLRAAANTDPATSRVPADAQPQDLFEWVAELVSTVSPNDIETIVDAMVRLEAQHERCATALLDRLVRVTDDLSATQIASILFGLARLGVRAHPTLSVLAAYCVDHSDRFCLGRDMVRMLHAFGRMGHTNRDVYNVFAGRLKRRPVLHYLEKQDVSLAFSAFGDARYLDEPLFRALGTRAIALAEEFGAVDVALTMHSYSQLYLLNEDLYNAMSSRALEIADQFSPAGATMVLNAFGKMNSLREDMTDALLDTLIPRLGELNTSDVAAMLTSLCQMEYSNAKHWGAIADFLSENVHQLTAQGLHDLCLVMQTLNWRDDKLLASIGDHSVRLQVAGSMNGPAARAILDTLGVFLHYHQQAREQLSESARSVSRDALALERGNDDGGGRHMSLGR